MTAYTRTPSRGPAAAAEAAQWLDEACAGHPVPSLLIVVGMGEGHLLDVLEQRAPGTSVLAIEPDPQMAAAFSHRRDWSRWRSSGRFVYLVHPDYAGADEAWRLFPRDTNACQLMVNASLDPRHPSTGHAARMAQKILYGVKANAEARRQFAPRYLTNVIRNIPAIARGADVRALTDAYRGIPAVIAAAGPSLDAAISELTGVTERALLIAVDTALRPLLHAGVAPHLVVAIDPSTLNARHFQALPECPDTWLVAESALDRSATQLFDGRTFWLRVSKHHPWPWLNGHGVDVGQIDVWGSVLTAALQVAILAGCDPIVLVGADLAFTGGRPYCRSTTYEFDWAWSLAAGRSLGHAWQHHIDSTKPRASTDVYGRNTVSSGSLEAFRDWIVSRARKSGRRVVNATGDGILHGGDVEQGTLASCLSTSVQIPSMRALAQVRASRGSRDVAVQIASVRDRLVSGDLSSSPLADWVEFSGDGFDAADVAGAIDEASGASESSHAAAAVAWAQPARSESLRVMTTLPEAMARLRAALEGADNPTPIREAAPLTRADRAALLVEALAIVGQLRNRLERQQDLKPTEHAELAGRLPATALYDWPEEARWGVSIVEAMLGMAWLGSVPKAETFFNGPVVPRAEKVSLDAGSGTTRHLNLIRASLVLAVEWMRCVISVVNETGTPTGETARLIGIESLVLATTKTPAAPATSRLTITAETGRKTSTVELPIGLTDGALARVLTGAVHYGTAGHAIATRIEIPELTVTIDVSSSEARRARGPRDRRVRNPLHARWLTDVRLQKAAIAYAVAAGVVCARLHERETSIVRADGSVEVHHQWPRPITSELPFGDDGAIAWDQGVTASTGALPSYVMYRRSASERTTIEELPFRPLLGVWWNERFYFSHAGSDSHPERGIASWAPGEPARFEIPGIAVYDLHPDGDSLVLEPRCLCEDGRPMRRLMTDAFSWQPGRGLQRIPRGGYGASSGRSRGNGWVAAAYPEADIVVLTSDDGVSIPMTVYYPFRVAWAGRSLLVSSVQSGVLLFENLADELDSMRRAA